MDAVTGVWSAYVPAIITSERSLKAKSHVLIIYASNEPLRVDILLLGVPGIPEHTWRLKYNLIYGPSEEITFFARKKQLAVTVPKGAMQLFLDNIRAMSQIGAGLDEVPAAWDALLRSST